MGETHLILLSQVYCQFLQVSNVYVERTKICIDKPKC